MSLEMAADWSTPAASAEVVVNMLSERSACSETVLNETRTEQQRAPDKDISSRLQGETLEALVSRAKSGDHEAFGRVVLALQEPLYRAVFRMLRHSQDARDVVQRAFLRAWTKLPELQSVGAFRSWLFAIGLNLARNQLRAGGGRRYEPVEETNLSVAPSAFRVMDDHQQRLRLRAALEQLPHKQRDVVTLRIDAELSFKEISEAVGCSEGSARVNFHHGMKRLRELVTSEVQ